MNDTRTSRIDIYAGPSITRSEIESLFEGVNADVRILPPVEQGDLLRGLTDLPDVIAIIDGYFYQVPSVLHKEILLTLEFGVRVLGAASLGALRAAELDVFGMEGVGRIYDMYVDGQIDGDDEVAVQHGPAEMDFRMLTVPLVNVRQTLSTACAEGAICENTARFALSAAKDIHFTERSCQAILDHSKLASLSADQMRCLTDVFRHRQVDVKHEDAVELLNLIADRVQGHRAWPKRTSVTVHRSKYLHFHEREYVGVRREQRQIPDIQVLSFQKLLNPEFPGFAQQVARQVLIADEARHQQIFTRSESELLESFRCTESLRSDEALDRWLRDRQLLRSDLVAWLLRKERCQHLIAETVARGEGFDERASQFEDELVIKACRRLGITEFRLSETVFSRQAAAWETPLIQELKCNSGFDEAWRQAAELLSAFDAQFGNNPGLWFVMQSLGEFTNEVVEDWACTMWGVAAEDFQQELRRRLFHHRKEFDEVARLAHHFHNSRS